MMTTTTLVKKHHHTCFFTRRRISSSPQYPSNYNHVVRSNFSSSHQLPNLNQSNQQISHVSSSLPHQQSISLQKSQKNVITILRSRGLLQDITNAEALESTAQTKNLLVYCGFDPTAESLHLGNLLGIIVLSWFQRCGHTPVALLGGATGRVGDPSGKSAERPILSDQTIDHNIQGIEKTLQSLLQDPIIVNNLEWFGDMSLLTFLRDIGKAARVGTMIAKESVKKRMESESGISYTEFTYQLLQGYDFVHLAKTRGVNVQIGGSDQWGNITAGTDLARKMLNVSENETECVYGMTFPLLLKSDGTKFGKSESGAVWLSSDMLSPYQFYQFLLKTTDADIPRFLKMLTFMPLEEIDALVAFMSAADYVANTAQKKLAEEVTRFVHGEEGLAQALKATAALAPGATTELDAAMLEASDAPSVSLSRDQVVGCMLAEVMVSAGMQPSKAAVRRMIKGGGVRVNNDKIDDELHELSEKDLIDGRLVLIAAGKKNKILVRVAS